MEDDKRILSDVIDDTVNSAVKSLGIGNNVKDEVEEIQRDKLVDIDENILKMRRGRR